MAEYLNPFQVRNRNKARSEDLLAQVEETKAAISQLVNTNGYLYLRAIGQQIKKDFHALPNDDANFSTYCKISWALDQLFKRAEEIAVQRPEQTLTERLTSNANYTRESNKRRSRRRTNR